MREPPYGVGHDSLVVSYYALAELSCHLALGWPLPQNLLDLYVEFRLCTSGRPRPFGAKLLGALAHFGLGGISLAEKESFRDLIARGCYSVEDVGRILDYCESDVFALDRLLPCMLPGIDLAAALYRGRYIRALAEVERAGVPVDVASLTALRDGWDGIKQELIHHVDSGYGVFEGSSFVAAKFQAWVRRQGIKWPVLDSGRLALNDKTFKLMAALHPQVKQLRDLRRVLGKLRTFDLHVGADDRHRAMLSPFGTKTGRNAPSTTKFVFGLPKFLRALVKPSEGHAVAYMDYEQQEFGIAAALANDRNMLTAYTSGDPYLSFAKLAGAVPQNATRVSHRRERELYKTCVLGVQYSMGPYGLATRLGVSLPAAEALLRQHRMLFPAYWNWSDAAVALASARRVITTCFGWPLHVDTTTDSRTIRNFPMQGNGGEMLRLAIILGRARGVTICAPVHDALLIEAPLDEIDDAIFTMKSAMAGASREVLGGFELRTEVEVVRAPARYMPAGGAAMWNQLQAILAQRSG